MENIVEDKNIKWHDLKESEKKMLWTKAKNNTKRGNDAE